jgi:drug/metabolite transporter (DMT)-like permease
LVPAGLIWQAVSGAPPVLPQPQMLGYLGAALAVGVVAYYGIVAAMRMGEVSFITPFRYARIIFALGIGIVVFDERPDMITLMGCLVIVLSGIYTIWRERKHRKPRAASLSIPATGRYDATK